MENNTAVLTAVGNQITSKSSVMELVSILKLKDINTKNNGNNINKGYIIGAICFYDFIEIIMLWFIFKHCRLSVLKVGNKQVSKGD